MIHFEALSHLKSMMLDDANQKDVEKPRPIVIYIWQLKLGCCPLDLYTSWKISKALHISKTVAEL